MGNMFALIIERAQRTPDLSKHVPPPATPAEACARPERTRAWTTPTLLNLAVASAPVSTSRAPVLLWARNVTTH